MQPGELFDAQLVAPVVFLSAEDTLISAGVHGLVPLVKELLE